MKKEDLSHQLQTILLDHDQPPENLKKALDAFFEPDCIALADQFTQLAQQSSGVATGTLYETLATDIQSHGIAFVGKLSNAFTRINILTVNYNDALEEILNASTRLERFCNEKYDWDGKFYRIRDRERQEIDPVADFIHTRLSWHAIAFYQNQWKGIGVDLLKVCGIIIGIFQPQIQRLKARELSFCSSLKKKNLFYWHVSRQSGQ